MMRGCRRDQVHWPVGSGSEEEREEGGGGWEGGRE